MSKKFNVIIAMIFATALTGCALTEPEASNFVERRRAALKDCVKEMLSYDVKSEQSLTICKAVYRKGE